MRERLAMGVAVFTVAVLVTLAVVFTRAQNPTVAAALDDPSRPETPDASSASSAETEPDTLRGRAVYESTGCQRCHSIAGIGNPRVPLDDVGSRRTPEQLRAWTLGADALADSLPPSAMRAKRAYRELAETDIRDLVFYLRTLRE
jgi:cytochrome c5